MLPSEHLSNCLNSFSNSFRCKKVLNLSLFAAHFSCSASHLSALAGLQPEAEGDTRYLPTHSDFQASLAVASDIGSFGRQILRSQLLSCSQISSTSELAAPHRIVWWPKNFLPSFCGLWLIPFSLLHLSRASAVRRCVAFLAFLVALAAAAILLLLAQLPQPTGDTSS